MMREMMMICLLENTIKCDRLKMVSPRINNGNQVIMKLLEDLNLMMIQMKKKVQRMRMKTMTRKVLVKMTMMIKVTTTSEKLNLNQSHIFIYMLYYTQLLIPSKFIKNLSKTKSYQFYSKKYMSRIFFRCLYQKHFYTVYNKYLYIDSKQTYIQIVLVFNYNIFYI